MLIVYADGGTRKKIGSWAYAIVVAPITSVETDYSGQLSGQIVSHGYGKHPEPLHSSHMELVAALEGVKRAVILARGNAPILVVSDSHYVTKGFSAGHARLRAAIVAHGEKSKRHGLVALWKEIIPICAFNDISTMHVKGHRQQTGNTLVDYMCGEVLSNRDPSELDHKVRLFNNSKIWRNSLVKTRR